MKIGVDIDDVLYPWYRTAHEVCEEVGITNGKTPTTWQVQDDYGCSLEEWIEALSEATVSGRLYEAPPFPGVLRSLERLVEAGHEVHLITARGWLQHGPVIKGHTIRWLWNWEVPYTSLTFARDKTILRADVFVDDHPKNWAALWAADLPCFLVQQTWNHDDHIDPALHNLAAETRVDSFNHFTDLVIKGEIHA